MEFGHLEGKQPYLWTTEPSTGMILQVDPPQNGVVTSINGINGFPLGHNPIYRDL